MAPRKEKLLWKPTVLTVNHSDYDSKIDGDEEFFLVDDYRIKNLEENKVDSEPFYLEMKLRPIWHGYQAMIDIFQLEQRYALYLFDPGMHSTPAMYRMNLGYLLHIKEGKLKATLKNVERVVLTLTFTKGSGVFEKAGTSGWSQNFNRTAPSAPPIIKY